MILWFYIAVNVCALAFFFRLKKRLHSIEIIVNWMTASYLFQNFSAFCYMNLKNINIPDKPIFEFAHVLNRVILYPLLMVTFLHFFLKARNLLEKICLFIGFVFLLTGLEWLADLLGVLEHKNWQIWWSFSLWSLGLLALIGFMKFFRRLLQKGEYRI